MQNEMVVHFVASSLLGGGVAGLAYYLMHRVGVVVRRR